MLREVFNDNGQPDRATEAGSECLMMVDSPRYLASGHTEESGFDRTGPAQYLHRISTDKATTGIGLVEFLTEDATTLWTLM